MRALIGAGAKPWAGAHAVRTQGLRIGRRGLGVLASAAVLAACNGEDEQRPDVAGDASRQGGRASVPANVYERNCRSQVRSGSVVQSGRDDLVVGPVTFFAARGFTRTAEFSKALRPAGAWGAAEKSVTVVEPGVSATVIVPARQRDSYLLIYGRFGSSIRVDGRDTAWFPRSAASAAVRFAACPPPAEGRTRAFNGGFLIRQPGCYALKVVSEEDPYPQRASIGFGVGREGCPGSR